MLLRDGSISISTDQILFPEEFNYGVNEHFLKVFVLSYVKLLSDSPLHVSIETDKPARVYMRFLKRLLTTDLTDQKVGIIKTFSVYSDGILRNEYSLGADSSTRVYHEFMKDTPIFKEYLEWIRTGDPLLLGYVLSFLRFGKKLEFEDPKLNATAFRGWLEVEEKLSTLEFGEVDIASLRNIISELLDPINPDHVLPKFGSGKVADRSILDVYDKLVKLKIDGKLAYAFQRNTQFNLGMEGLGLAKDLRLSNSSTDRTSRLKFVPKDISKSRSICMEPNHYMYFQQEVLRWIVRSMDRSPIRKFVNLRDQSLNRDLALHGSLAMSMDTIDLSNASDSVHVDLVKSVFPRDWLFYMLATRTSKVLTPDGVTRNMNKFAPMGSAICFPTQCILFTAMCIYAYGAYEFSKTTGVWEMSCSEARKIIRQVTVRASDSTPFGRGLESPVVYGDDIICDSRVTDRVIALLFRLGFEVNVDKSFTGFQSFRESCGVYCYEGSDVTPVLFRLPFFRKGGWDAKVYASIIGNINYARGRGYHATASYWLSLLREYGFENPIPFVETTDAFGVFTTRKRGFKPKALLKDGVWYIRYASGHRWRARYQIFEERVQGIGPRVPRRNAPARLEQYRLDQWWRSRIIGGTTSPITRSLTIRPQETRLVSRWTRYE